MREMFPPGLPDDAFIRGKVPMTKSEVRAVTMSKARLRDGLRVLDIGAGTGSLTIEAALLCPAGTVTAVERDAEALGVLAQNIAHFGVRNVTVIPGEAPDALAGHGPFDRIFLGGFGGHLEEILAVLPNLLTPGGRVVANTIGMESTAAVLSTFRNAPWTEWEIVQISVSRGVPVWQSLTRFEALNPVWITSAQLGEA